MIYSETNKIDMYEVELMLYRNNDRKVLTVLQEYGEIREERYIWGRDSRNRPRRESLRVVLILPRSRVSVFKMRLSKLSQNDDEKLSYRLVSNLV